MAVARRRAKRVPSSTYVVPRWLSLTNPMPIPKPSPHPHTRTQSLVAGHWLSARLLYYWVDYAGACGYCDGTFHAARRAGRYGAPR